MTSIKKAKRAGASLGSWSKQTQVIEGCKSPSNSKSGSKPALCDQVRALLLKEANAFHEIQELRTLTSQAIRAQLRHEGQVRVICLLVNAAIKCWSIYYI